jgi:hypothetical protein
VAEPKQSQQKARPTRSRAKIVKPGRMPVSEFAFDRAGAGSPFGDDITFPVPADRLTYQHPDVH